MQVGSAAARLGTLCEVIEVDVEDDRFVLMGRDYLSQRIHKFVAAHSMYSAFGQAVSANCCHAAGNLKHSSDSKST